MEGELQDKDLKMVQQTEKLTETDSLANSSCYNQLINDLNSFNLQQFVEHDKEKRDIEFKLKLNPEAVVPYRKDSAMFPAD